MTGWSDLLRQAHKFRIKNNLSHGGVAEVLDKIAEHHRWYVKHGMELTEDDKKLINKIVKVIDD